LAVTRDVNKFRVVVNRDCLSEAYFQFDYLDGGDGAIFEIMHTGLKGRPRITGSLRGIPKGVENWGTLWNWEKGKSPLDELRRSLTALGAIVTVGGMAIFLVNYLRKAHPNAMSILDLAFNVAMSAIIGGVFLVFIILLWVGQVRRSPKSLRLSGESRGRAAALEHAVSPQVPLLDVSVFWFRPCESVNHILSIISKSIRITH